jgi:hypothetical protein
MRKFLIAYKTNNNQVNVNDIVRNIKTHEIFVVLTINNNIGSGSSFGESDISDLEVITIGIQPLNLYTNIDDMSNISWNPFKNIKNKKDRNKWLQDEEYCKNSFIHFNSKEFEIKMISKIGTIIDSGSVYFYNTFKYVMP